MEIASASSIKKPFQSVMQTGFYMIEKIIGLWENLINWVSDYYECLCSSQLWPPSRIEEEMVYKKMPTEENEFFKRSIELYRAVLEVKGKGEEVEFDAQLFCKMAYLELAQAVARACIFSKRTDLDCVKEKNLQQQIISAHWAFRNLKAGDKLNILKMEESEKLSSAAKKVQNEIDSVRLDFVKGNKPFLDRLADLNL